MRRIAGLAVTLTVIAACVGVTAAPATAGTITATYSAMLGVDESGEPDTAGLIGASFVYELVFSDGATWASTVGNIISVAPASHALTISGASVASSNDTFFTPALFFNYNTANNFAGYGNGTPNSNGSFPDFALPSSVDLILIMTLQPPATVPSATDILSVNHFGSPTIGNIGFGVESAVTTVYRVLEPSLVVTMANVPEPTTLLLLGAGLAAVGVRRYRAGREQAKAEVS